MPPKKTKDSDLCASGLTEPLERKIMATAMKQGEDQINIVREAQAKEKPTEDSDE